MSIRLASLILLLGSATMSSALEWRIQANQVQVLDVQVDKLQLDSDAARLLLEQISHPSIGVIGSLEARCSPVGRLVSCDEATLAWQRPNQELVTGTLSIDESGLDIQLADSSLRATLQEGSSGPFVSLQFEEWMMEWLPEQHQRALGLTQLEGRIGIDSRIADDELSFEATVASLSFDTENGAAAAANIELNLSGLYRPATRSIEAAVQWVDGEALLGPVYLPPPPVPVTLSLKSDRPSNRTHWESQLQLVAGDFMRLRAAMDRLPDLTSAEHTLAAISGQIDLDRLDLASVWPMGLNSVADWLGFGRIEPAGSITGQVKLLDGQIGASSLKLDHVDVLDARDQFSVIDLAGQVSYSGGSEQFDVMLSWQDAALLNLELGPSQITLSGDEAGRIALNNPPFRLPVLDGALLVHQLEWSNWASDRSDLKVDIELEPIQLVALSRAFGWPDLGGTVSGRLADARWNQGVLRFDGGILVDLFSGRLTVNQLQIERPLGPLPALAGDIRFDQLDLYELTGAFDIGSMQGRMSGYMNGLRLLNWQPVAFDAWFATDAKTSSKRRISQQAVDSISSLSGGGGAVLSNTVLRVFEDFPYARVGIGCRLSETICQMRGLEERDNGGYLIVEGRGLPNLNIIGYQRRVDWQRLMSHIQSAAQGGVSLEPPMQQPESGGNDETL